MLEEPRIIQELFLDDKETIPGIKLNKVQERKAPLAHRMRPRSLEEIAGQKDILGPNTLLERVIRSDTLTSAIFYGPPGCGKTTLAEVIAHTTKRSFSRLSAVIATVKDVRQVVDYAQRHGEQGLVLFLDEIHRFNKAQQDVLLPHVENGTLILIGATTENPFFALNSALISRSRVFQFKALSEADILQLLKRALKDPERGLGKIKITSEAGVLEHLAKMSDGDVRVALSALELMVQSAIPDANGLHHISLADADLSIQKNIVYDRKGDGHYDTISAFIKSMRGSDPDAALYWLGKMLVAGEDPRFIARRMIIFASEDIGCADPLALQQANNAYTAVERIGMPEAQLNLAHVTVYLACSPKSNACYKALQAVQKDIKKNMTLRVPASLKDAHFASAKELGHGQDYKYSHDYPGHFVPQDYMGQDRIYYQPTQEGWESKIAQRLSAWRQLTKEYKDKNN